MALFFRSAPRRSSGSQARRARPTNHARRSCALSGLAARRGRRQHRDRFIQEVDNLRREDIVVLELRASSSKRSATARRCRGNEFLEDHIDHHGLATRTSRRRRTSSRAGPAGHRLLNLDDPSTVALHTGAASEVRAFRSRSYPSACAHPGPERETSYSCRGDRRTSLQGERAPCARTAQRRERARRGIVGRVRHPGRHVASCASSRGAAAPGTVAEKTGALVTLRLAAIATRLRVDHSSSAAARTTRPPIRRSLGGGSKGAGRSAAARVLGSAPLSADLVADGFVTHAARQLGARTCARGSSRTRETLSPRSVLAPSPVYLRRRAALELARTRP